MDRTRVVGVNGTGSGYLLTADLVLTSAHAVDTKADVFRPGHPDRYYGTVVWRGTPGGRDDAALIALDRPAFAQSLHRIRWGRLVSDRPNTPAETCGLPNLVQRPDRAADTAHLSGTINPGDRAIGDRHVLALSSHPPSGPMPWAGLSGAPLFCGDLLTGVITTDPAHRAHAHLEAVPAYVLHQNPHFREATGLTLEPVEFQNAIEPEPTGDIPSPAALLQARREIVPFRHREELLADLVAWASVPGVSIRLIHGPGGQGKTRLARELSSRLENWAIVWLAPNAQVPYLNDAAVPLLVIVDYAETRTTQLNALLDICARHDTRSPLKVLLLARTAGSWWDSLPTASSAVESLLDGALATLLPALEPEPDGRLSAYHDAIAAFAAALGEQTPALPEPALPAGGVLTLHMTALADLLDAAQHTTTALNDVEDRLLIHERRYWISAAHARGLDHHLSLDTLTDALAAATALDADTVEDAHALLARVPGLTDQPHDRRESVRRWIADLYPPPIPNRPWDTLQPDRLAERFIGRRALTNPSLAAHLVPGATEQQAERLLTFHARAAAHPALAGQVDTWLVELCALHPNTLSQAAIRVATQVERPGPLIAGLRRVISNPAISCGRLQQLADEVPQSSQALANWAAELATRLVTEYRVAVRDDPANLLLLANGLVHLSVRLGGLGRSEDSLTACLEAVEICREASGGRLNAFRVMLGVGLTNLAAQLPRLGRLEEALAASMEAVEICRELQDVSSDFFRRDLALGLNNLSAQLGPLGLLNEALEASSESVEIYRQLVDQRPEFLPELAMSLSNLSNCFGELGRSEEGLAAISEAVQIRRRVAQARPDEFLPDLATGLHNQSNRLVESGRWEEGLDVGLEAIKIRERLAQARPDAFLPDLAMSIYNVSVILGEMECWKSGTIAITEAINIFRHLAEGRPGIFDDMLAKSLDVLDWLEKASDEVR